MSAALWIEIGQPAKAYRCFATDDSLLFLRRRMNRIAQRARVDQALGRDPRRLFEAALAVYDGAPGDHGRIRIEIELAAGDVEASAKLKTLHDRARALGFAPLCASAAAKRALALARGVNGSAAAPGEIIAWTRYAESLIDPDGVSTAVRLIDLLSDCAVAYSACSSDEDERRCLDRAVEWLRAAKGCTPAAYRPGLLRRHERLIARAVKTGLPGVLL